jgi:16S rRNA (guanine966-N2)-methyltransferase
MLSRGAKRVYLCDISKKAIDIINQNLSKTKLSENANVENRDYKQVLKDCKAKKIKFDIIYIDPPYKENISAYAVKIINENDLLKEDGIIIIETDEEQRDLKELEKIKDLKYKVYDSRKYGRAHLIFLQSKDA